MILVNLQEKTIGNLPVNLNRPLETLLGHNKRAGWSTEPTDHDPTDENAPESSDREIANQEMEVAEKWLWETNASISVRFCLAKPFSIPKPQIVFIQFHFLRIEALLGHSMGGDLLRDDPGTSHIVSPSSGVK